MEGTKRCVACYSFISASHLFTYSKPSESAVEAPTAPISASALSSAEPIVNINWAAPAVHSPFPFDDPLPPTPPPSSPVMSPLDFPLLIPPSPMTSLYMLSQLAHAVHVFTATLIAARLGDFHTVTPNNVRHHLYYMHYVLHYLADIARYAEYFEALQGDE